MFRTEPLGSPGVYTRPSTPEFALSSERMDVSAFVGIAPRGPARIPDLPDWWREAEGSYMSRWNKETLGTRRSTPVPVESFEHYQRLFGGFEGPGLLPYAVSAFFAQGGVRAYIVRVVHDYADDVVDQHGVASGTVEGVTLANSSALMLRARNEGTWGNALRAAIGFNLKPVVFAKAELSRLVLTANHKLSVGTLIRCAQPAGKPLLRFINHLEVAIIDGRRQVSAWFDISLPEPPVVAEVVTAELIIDDGAGVVERHTDLGLSSEHPRWLAKQLCYHSELVYPMASWESTQILPTNHDRLPTSVKLPKRDEQQFSGGLNRYADLVHEDFFDATWSPAEHLPGDGVHALAGVADIASVMIPDLYCPEEVLDFVPAKQPVSFASEKFEPCVDLDQDPDVVLPPPNVNQLCLDPTLPSDRQKIVVLQQRFVDFADTQKCWVALLDVPPELRVTQMLEWREQFDSSYAAAYWPWLDIVQQREAGLVTKRINPSAFAAGIIAKRELDHGVHFGPANEFVNTVVGLDQPVSEPDHDQLHQSNINVYSVEPDGIRLSAARTLSSEPHLRQLNIRRFLILLKRALMRQTQWITFENNGPALWRQLTRTLENYLSNLYRVGVFKGANTEEAFFVRCNEQNNTQRTQDQGQLIADIGVAPAEPTEFILLRLSQQQDQLTVEES